MSRPRCFLDVQIGTESAGRLTIELFTDKTPKTCENFRAICINSHPPLSYKKAPFHRVIDEFMIQGGDITNGDGTGGDSIYGGEFEDENLDWREIDSEGLVCMANRGKGTNSSQFFITLEACEHLNGKHTVFGHIVSGQETMQRMAKVDVDKDDKPITDVFISHCGELERKKKSRPVAIENDKPSIRHDDEVEAESSDDGSERHRKRRRSTSTDNAAVSNDSSISDTRQHRDSRKRDPVSEKTYPPQKKRSRRRSDHSMDGTLRGRTRQRADGRDATPIDEEERNQASSSSKERERHRKRSPSPSRNPRRHVDESPRFRRRRSLPNQYERLKKGSRYYDEYRLQQEELDRDGGQGRYDNIIGSHDNSRSASNSRLDGGGSYDQGPVKFKGRGSMKYREPTRY